MPHRLVAVQCRYEDRDRGPDIQRLMGQTGWSYDDIANILGTHYQTVYGWAKQGRTMKAAYWELLMIKRAVAEKRRQKALDAVLISSARRKR